MLDLAPTVALQAHPRLAGLGLEPLDADFDGPALAAALAGRFTALKLALMDQRVVVGVGNIYACEGLFRARLSPRRIAGHLRPREATRLAEAVRAVLMEAIEAGGSSLRDYVQTDGQLGFYQERFAVYGLSGQPCRACGTAIRRIAQANRTTFYCPRCQR
jgi:formamidopyrimidine-DNA glycosylase